MSQDQTRRDTQSLRVCECMCVLSNTRFFFLLKILLSLCALMDSSCYKKIHSIFIFFLCVVHLTCSLFNVNSSYQTVIYMFAAVLLYLMPILKAFIIINAYEFYFQHYSLCYKHMPEDHYLKIPICNELFCSNQIYRDSCVYICMYTHTHSRKR
jgi:hypothetical protein